jgi:hypothetical protein
MILTSVAALEKMLHLNINPENGDLTSSQNDEEIMWKVLVLDFKSTAIISSVLRLNDLLKSGITMHTLIQSSRSPLPDVPAIYFVEPTQENITRIAQDIKDDKYSSFYINFTSTLSRDLLEELAGSVATTGKSQNVLQVYDQYLNYVVTEPSLFSLEVTQVYSKFNDAKTTEEEINSIADNITDGLYNAIITLGQIPIIRSQSGGPSELVAEKLDQKLRDYWISTKSLNGSGADYSQRLVLILLDRNVDLAAMFAHSWIYQCLVADVFKLNRNTITIQTEENGQKVEKKYDLDPKDFFWTQNAQLPFPDAVDNADNELKNYKERATELTRGQQNYNNLDGKRDDTLQQTVNQLPELTARKAVIDMHMNVLLLLLNELKAKGLDSFFEIEQSLSDPKSRNRFLEVLKTDGNTANLEDKLRTFIVLYLTTDLSSDYVHEVEELFNKVEGLDMTPFTQIKKVKESLRLKDSSTILNSYIKDSSDNGSSNQNSSALFSNLSSKLYNLADGKITEGVGSLISGIKRLLPEKKAMPITNIVETLMDPTNSNEERLKLTDDYLYFDPKVTRGAHSRQPKRQSYSESVVFVVGGGNYLEYQNLQEWSSQLANQGNIKKVTYGSTHIYSPTEFLKEVSLNQS